MELDDKYTLKTGLGSVLVNDFWINFVHDEIIISIYLLLFRIRLG